MLSEVYGARELCDGRDEDADGSIDLGCPSSCPDLRSRSGESVLTTANVFALIGRDRSLAWDGRRFAAVWSQLTAPDQTIYFRLADPAGKPLGTPTPLYTGPVEEDPVIAWSGSGYGVVWSDEDFGLPRLLFMHLNPDGAITAGPVEVNTTGQDGTRPSIAWDGEAFTVAWAWYNSRVHMRRITAAGVRLGSEGCLNCSAASGTQEISIAVTPSGRIGYLYGNNTGGITFGQTDKNFVAQGALLPIVSSVGAAFPSLVWNGSEWGAVWFDRRASAEAIWFNRLNTVPAKLLASDLQLSGSEPNQAQPSVVFTGSEYLVAWMGGTSPPWSTYMQRISPSGTLLGSRLSFPVGQYSRSHTTLVWNGSRPLLLRDEDEAATRSPVYLRALDCCADRDADGVSWCDGDRDDGDPAAKPTAIETCNGRDDDVDGSLDESGCDRSCLGSTLGSVQPLGDSASIEVAVARGGSDAWIVHDDAPLSGTQLALDRGGPPFTRHPLDSDPTDSDQPVSAWCGDRQVTVYRDQSSGTPQLRAAIHDPAGAPLLLAEPLTAAPVGAERPRLACAARRALVVYRQQPGNELRFTLLTADGSRTIDGARLDAGLQPHPTEHAVVRDPRGGFAVLWWSGATNTLQVARIDEDGALLGAPVTVANAAVQANRVVLLAPTSSGFLAAWTPTGPASASSLDVLPLDSVGTPLGAVTNRPILGATSLASPDLLWTGAELELLGGGDGTAGALWRFALSEGGAPLAGWAATYDSEPTARVARAAWDGAGLRLAWTSGAGTQLAVRTAHANCAVQQLTGVPRLTATPSPAKNVWSWTGVEAPDARYDLVSGNLTTLLIGNLAAAADLCEVNDTSATSFTVPANRPAPRFFVVRPSGFAQVGSWNDNSAGLIASRDPAIAACP